MAYKELKLMMKFMKFQLSVDKALEIIERERGRQFDPQLADLFVKLVREKQIEVKN